MGTEKSSVCSRRDRVVGQLGSKERRMDGAIDPFFAAVQDYLAAFLSLGGGGHSRSVFSELSKYGAS